MSNNTAPMGRNYKPQIERIRESWVIPAESLCANRA